MAFELDVPAVLAAGLGACTQTGGATQPGSVNTSAANSCNSNYSNGAPGRVMSIREVALSVQAGMNNGTLACGLLSTVGGNFVSRNGSSQRGIEVTVQKDAGQTGLGC